MVRNVIVPTKLHRPPVPGEWIERPSLLQRLNAGFSAGRLVTLVSAPAGFGKSCCVSRWIETLADVPSAWLSLEPSDDDPGCFFPYFIAALRMINETIGRDIGGILAAGEIPPVEAISAALAGDMLRLESPFVIVLDDLHFIQDPLIHRMLEILVNAPPAALRMVFITREDPPLPIARLRANGRLTEIRGIDLRFDGMETRQFLNEAMNLSLSDEDASRLEMKTEGWAAGLKLAALALQGPGAGNTGGDAGDFIASLSGRHHYIGTYLTEQVLSRLQPDLGDFLLQTSILEKLNADVCRAVTERTDSGRILKQLSSENLFIIPLDDQNRFYRYHHLFADLLKETGINNLSVPAEELHRRAAAWYRDAGEPEPAIRHSLAARDYPAAAELLEEHAMDIIMHGHVKTLDSWVHALPGELVIRSLRINLAFAWMHVLRGDVPGAGPWLKQLESIFSGTSPDGNDDAGDSGLRAEWQVLLSLLAYGQGKMNEALELAEQALKTAPPGALRVRSMAYYAGASACNVLGMLQKAEEGFNESLRTAVASSNQIAELLSIAGLWVSAFEHGRLRHSEEIILPVMERLEKSDSQPSMSCVIYGGLAEIYFQRNRREEARELMLRSLRLSTLGGYAGQIGCRVFLSRLDLLEGDPAAAELNISEALKHAGDDTPAFIMQEVAAQQVRCRLAAKKPDDAASVLEPFGFGFDGGLKYPLPENIGGMSYSLGLLYASCLQIILRRAESLGDASLLAAGLELANLTAASALDNHLNLTAIQILLLRSRLKAMMGQGDSGGREDVNLALRLGQDEDVCTLFLEQGETFVSVLQELLRRPLPKYLSRGYIRNLISAFGEGCESEVKSSPDRLPDESADNQTLNENLTAREIEVLGCMSRGMKYQEIADTLYVSLNTVRFHVKSIYGKMAVDNRTKAVEKARRFGLMPK